MTTSTTSTKRSRTSSCVAALLAAALLGAAEAAPDVALRDASAKATIQRVVTQALAVLRDGSIDEKEKQRRIQAIAAERFDFKRISKLVLARNWKKLTPEQRDQFLVEFKRHLSLTYGRRLSGFSDENVVIGEVQGHSNGDVTVRTKIVGGSADGVAMNYRMRERDGDWFAIDIVIEGVSMIANFRSQVQEIVSQKGPEGLIEALRDKNDHESLGDRGPV